MWAYESQQHRHHVAHSQSYFLGDDGRRYERSPSSNNSMFSLYRRTHTDPPTASPKASPKQIESSRSSSNNSNVGSKEPQVKRPYISAGRRRVIIFMLSVSIVLLVAGTSMLTPNAAAIASDLAMDEETLKEKLGGRISLGFLLLGLPMTFLVGCYADEERYSRTKIFGWLVGVGQSTCLLSCISQNYSQLAIFQAVSSYCLGAAFPLMYAILSDLIGPRGRFAMCALISLGFSFGTYLGETMASAVEPVTGWRGVFPIVALPALFCASRIHKGIEDPLRGFPAREVPKGGGFKFPSVNLRYHMEAFNTIVSTPTIVLLLLQGTPGCLPFSVLNTYWTDILETERGLSDEMVSLTSLMYGFGKFCGTLVGGFIGGYLYRLDRRFPALLAGAMAMLGCAPYWVMLNALGPSSSIGVIVGSAFFCGLTITVTGPIAVATLLNATPGFVRCLSMALFHTLDDFGYRLAPADFRILAESVGGQAAINGTALTGWIFCGVLNLLVFTTVVPDEHIAERLAETDEEQSRLPA